MGANALPISFMKEHIAIRGPRRVGERGKHPHSILLLILSISMVLRPTRYYRSPFQQLLMYFYYTVRSSGATTLIRRDQINGLQHRLFKRCRRDQGFPQENGGRVYRFGYVAVKLKTYSRKYYKPQRLPTSLSVHTPSLGVVCHSGGGNGVILSVL